MLCDQCFLRNAQIHITNIRGGSMTTRHLCQECASEESFSLMGLGKLMKGLFFVIGGTPQTKQKTLPKLQKDLECLQCHYRASDFQKTQKVGCPACYEVFRDLLTPGELKYKTISPPPVPKEIALSADEGNPTETYARAWEQLQGQLYQAVKEENYEEAAKLRDQLRTALGSTLKSEK